MSRRESEQSLSGRAGRGLLAIARSPWPLRRAFGVIARAGLPARAEGGIQGTHEVAAGLQCVRQDGPGRAGLAERDGHDQGPAPVHLPPGGDEQAAAGRVAPGPATMPKPLMSAAETPAAGHEIAPSRDWPGAADPAVGAKGAYAAW
jgi:hypothetical protein